MTVVSVLIFELDDTRYGIPAGIVRHIVAAVWISPLPGAPPVVDGVISVRGMLVPVFDPRRRFGLPVVPLDPAQHFIVADRKGRHVALRVDRAVDLVQIDASLIDTTPDVQASTPYVQGVARLKGGLLVIHDLDRFLSGTEERALDDAIAAHSGKAGAD